MGMKVVEIWERIERLERKLLHLMLCALFGMFSCRSVPLATEDAVSELVLRDNYQLNYNLAYGEERYQFIVDVKQLHPDLTFKYTMTNKKYTSGFITITEQALDSADIEKNTFGGGSDTLKDNQITVWFSKAMFNSLIENDTAVFDGDRSVWGSNKSTFFNAGKTYYDYELNGVPRRLEVIVVYEEVGENKRPKSFWVLNNPNNPLIIKMDVGWEIWLKEVNHNYENDL